MVCGVRCFSYQDVDRILFAEYSTGTALGEFWLGDHGVKKFRDSGLSLGDYLTARIATLIEKEGRLNPPAAV